MSTICCKECLSPDCKGCNLYILSEMLHEGKLDALMNENNTIKTGAIESLLTYKKAFDNIFKIGGLWVVDRSSDRPCLRYVDVDPFPKGARKYRLSHYNGQKLSCSNYAYVHSMDRDELARFLGETAAKWCDFEDKTEEEAKHFREWLDEEVEI